ncbi:MAG: T9SS type A sorting domain-containing protein [Bacteroidetes bacterium]|nr:T9SS type A sorting domain-containing protein [Bacteroidota bacterium]
MKNLLLLFALLFSIIQIQAQPVPQDSTDLVWSTKTDQTLGFYMVKFSITDSIIVGHGYDYDLFFDANTGQEFKRIIGNNEIFFINNDRNFIRLNEAQTKFEIFDTGTFEVIDSLESDGIKIGTSDISKDEKYLVAYIERGIREWDLATKKIIRTKLFPQEPSNLEEFSVSQINFCCDNSKIIFTLFKLYTDTTNPGHNYYRLYHPIFDFNTLDSIDAFQGMAYFRLSHDCLKIAFKRTDPDSGVEVYDFNSKQLLWKIPINGPSLTGIEFSPDDRYLVTSNGPGTDALKIWSIETGKETYDYGMGSRDCIDVSHDSQFIVSGSSSRMTLRNAKFGSSIVPGDSEITPQIIYPNPTTGVATIQFKQKFSEITNIYISGINGEIVKPILNNFLEAGIKIIELNTQDITNGTYFVKVENAHQSLVFKLIVSK